MKVFEKEDVLSTAQYIVRESGIILSSDRHQCHILIVTPKRIQHLPDGPWVHHGGRTSSFVHTFDSFPFTQRVRKKEAAIRTCLPEHLPLAEQQLREARLHSATQIQLCLEHQPGAILSRRQQTCIILLIWAELRDFPVALELCRLFRKTDIRFFTVLATNPHRSSDKLHTASLYANHVDVVYIGEKRHKAKTLKSLLDGLLLALGLTH